MFDSFFRALDDAAVDITFENQYNCRSILDDLNDAGVFYANDTSVDVHNPTNGLDENTSGLDTGKAYVSRHNCIYPVV